MAIRAKLDIKGGNLFPSLSQHGIRNCRIVGAEGSGRTAMSAVGLRFRGVNRYPSTFIIWSFLRISSASMRVKLTVSKISGATHPATPPLKSQRRSRFRCRFTLKSTNRTDIVNAIASCRPRWWCFRFCRQRIPLTDGMRLRFSFKLKLASARPIRISGARPPAQ